MFSASFILLYYSIDRFIPYRSFYNVQVSHVLGNFSDFISYDSTQHHAMQRHFANPHLTSHHITSHHITSRVTLFLLSSLHYTTHDVKHNYSPATSLSIMLHFVLVLPLFFSFCFNPFFEDLLISLSLSLSLSLTFPMMKDFYVSLKIIDIYDRFGGQSVSQ